MKQIILLSSLTVISAVAFVGCESSGNTNVSVNANRSSSMTNTIASTANSAMNSAGNAVNTVANAVSRATTGNSDDFIKEAAQGGMAEVELGKIAVKNAKDAEVKKFGQMMVDDHSKANTDLKALAAKKTITLPADMGSHQSTIDKMKGLSGVDFDKAYVSDMVDDHEKDVAAFQKQADNATDPEVKAFAAKTLPVLKKHLATIKAVQAKMK